MRAAAMRATPHAADVEGGAVSVSSRSRPDVEDVRIAYHEAAHAVAHYVLREGSSIRVVTIEPSARWSGVCLTSGNRSRLDATMDDLVCPLPLMNARVRRTLECDAIASLVGQLAEDYAFPKSRRGTTPAEDRAEETVAMLTGHEQRRLKAAKRKRRRTPTDTENAERQAWLLAGNDLMPAQLALLRAIARELVLSPRFRRLVEALVPALLEHRTLGGRRVVAIVKAADSTGGA